MESVKVLLADFVDVPKLKKLWKDCFLDEDKFIEWFFLNRFFYGNVSLIKDGDVLASAMFSNPIHLNVRDTIISSSLLCGFCTDKNYRNRSYMKNNYKFLLERLSKADVILAPLTPVVLEGYYSLGAFPISRVKFVSYAKVSKRISIKNERFSFNILYNKSMKANLFFCYNSFKSKYSGIVSRSIADFTLKLDDYFAYDAKCIYCKENDEVRGYFIYFETENKIYVEEAIALSDKSYEFLSKHIYNLALGKSLKIKLPPDCNYFDEKATVSIEPKGVVGVVNVSLLLKKLGRGLDFTFLIKDPVLECNNGVFNMKGETVKGKYQFEIKAGRLAQFLVGFHSLNELFLMKELIVLDESAFKSLDCIFEKEQCFILDEY